MTDQKLTDSLTSRFIDALATFTKNPLPTQAKFATINVAETTAGLGRFHESFAYDPRHDSLATLESATAKLVNRAFRAVYDVAMAVFAKVDLRMQESKLYYACRVTGHKDGSFCYMIDLDWRNEFNAESEKYAKLGLPVPGKKKP